MVQALKEFGFRIPILARGDGEVIDGHLRLKAALEMGLETVPVITADDMTPEQIRAFRILVNKSASWAEWDEALLVEEIRALQAESFDVHFTGFDMAELDKLLASVAPSGTDDAGEPEEEALPEPPFVPVTRPGDIWQIGDHALACADAADAEAVAELMDGELAALCFTSPPYGEQREYTRKIGDWDTLMRGVTRDATLGKVMLPDGQVLVNLGLVHRAHEVRPYWNTWIQEMRDKGWRFFGWYVWDQGWGMPGDWNGRLAPSHEFIFHFNRQERKPNKIVPCIYAGQTSHLRKNGTSSAMRNPDGTVGSWTHAGKVTQDYRIPDSILRIGRQRGPIGEDIDHPAVFPVALPEYVIATWAQPGEVVYEPFCGSGTAIIAGQRQGVKVRAAEIAPAYVDVALIRFSRMFPDVPVTLRSSGETFAALAAARKEETHV
jgi:DNA modification methylase